MAFGDPLGSLLDALLSGDYGRVERVFAPKLSFRAALPHKIVEAESATGAAASYRDWYGDAEELRLEAVEREMVGGVTAFHYRIRARSQQHWFVIRQAGAFEATADGITNLRLACTGFQAESSG